MSLETDLAAFLSEANALSPEDRRYRNLVGLVADLRQALGTQGNQISAGGGTRSIAARSVSSAAGLSAGVAISAAAGGVLQRIVGNYTDTTLYLRFRVQTPSETPPASPSDFDFPIPPGQAVVLDSRSSNDWLGGFTVAGAPTTGQMVVTDLAA